MYTHSPLHSCLACCMGLALYLSNSCHNNIPPYGYLTTSTSSLRFCIVVINCGPTLGIFSMVASAQLVGLLGELSTAPSWHCMQFCSVLQSFICYDYYPPQNDIHLLAVTVISCDWYKWSFSESEHAYQLHSNHVRKQELIIGRESILLYYGSA